MPTAKNSPINHKLLILLLLEAVQLPSQTAVKHCRGCQRDSSSISEGSNLAGGTAKLAARSLAPRVTLTAGQPDLPSYPKRSPTDREEAEKGGYSLNESGCLIDEKGEILTLKADQWKGKRALHEATHNG